MLITATNKNVDWQQVHDKSKCKFYFLITLFKWLQGSS